MTRNVLGAWLSQCNCRCVKFGPDPPSGLLDGLGHGLGAAAYEVAGGFYDLIAKPIEGAREGGLAGAALGMAEGVVGLIARPIRGGGILIDKISTSLGDEKCRRRNRTVQETMRADGSKGSRFKLNFAIDENCDNSPDELRSDTDDDLSEEARAIEQVQKEYLDILQVIMLTKNLHTSGSKEGI